MNTTKLQRQYDKLTTLERFALIRAAKSRGDDSELRALSISAPLSKPYRFIDAWGWLAAMDMLAMGMTIDLLNAAYAMCLLAYGGDARSERVGRMAAYVFCVKLDAWRKLCNELGVSSDDELRDFGSIQIAEGVARAVCFTYDEARECLGGGDDPLITVDGVEAAMRARLERMAAQWS
jgi:hypothetical protein